jgi:hypothetical protein
MHNVIPAQTSHERLEKTLATVDVEPDKTPATITARATLTTTVQDYASQMRSITELPEEANSGSGGEDVCLTTLFEKDPPVMYTVVDNGHCSGKWLQVQ